MGGPRIAIVVIPEGYESAEDFARDCGVEMVGGSDKETIANDELLHRALFESLILQSHYAVLLNSIDGGNRMTFATVKDWIERLRIIGKLP